MTDAQRMLMAQEGTGPMQNGRFLPYKDSEGRLTIGYGHLVENGLAAEVANMQFQVDIADAVQAARQLFSCYDSLSRTRQLVLISMAYNLGHDGLSKWPHFISAVQIGQYDEAADQLLDSKAAREQAPARYQQLASMMRVNRSEWT
jgi:lysozyme